MAPGCRTRPTARAQANPGGGRSVMPRPQSQSHSLDLVLHRTTFAQSHPCLRCDPVGKALCLSRLPDLRSCPAHTGTLEPRSVSFHTAPQRSVSYPSQCPLDVPDWCTDTLEICINFYIHERIVFRLLSLCSFKLYNWIYSMMLCFGDVYSGWMTVRVGSWSEMKMSSAGARYSGCLSCFWSR